MELQELLTYFLTFINDGNSNANLGSIANATEIAWSQGCVNLVCNLEIGTQFSDSEMHSTILRLCKSLDYVEHIHSYGGNKQYGNY